MQRNVELVEIDRNELLDTSAAVIAANLQIGQKQADEVANQFMHAELAGKRTHGFARVPWLVGMGIHGHEEPTIVDQDTLTTTFECQHSVGYLAANAMADHVRAVAEQTGFAAAIGRNVFPSNTLNYYMQRIIHGGDMVGVIVGSTGPLVSPPGSSERILGTTPLAIGLEHDGLPVVSDITTAKSAFGSLLVAKYWNEFEPSDFITKEGAQPQTPDDLFENGAFTGSVAQSVEENGDRKLFALSLVLQSIMNTVVKKDEGKGNLIMLAFKLPASSEDDAATQLIPGFSTDMLPGVTSYSKQVENIRKPTISLPKSLWQDILDLQ